MKTVSLNVCTLCVPCNCHCKYCLLSYDATMTGASYQRSVNYAVNLQKQLGRERPELDFMFYFGYSMEHPKLLSAIDFMKELGSPAGEFLQFNGMKFRDDKELGALMEQLVHHGIKMLDCTFYGLKKYHDQFALREGDFDYLLRIIEAANRAKINVEVGIALFQDNAEQVDELLSILEQYMLERVTLFVPHMEGRGDKLEQIRFTRDSLKQLGGHAREYFNEKRFRTESQWLKDSDFSVNYQRALFLVLTQENIGKFEHMECNQIIRYLEELDDEYFKSMPDISTLASELGDRNGQCYYSERDLYMKYQKQFQQEKGLHLYNINDETHDFVRRF